jgi:hypothetical protein
MRNVISVNFVHNLLFLRVIANISELPGEATASFSEVTEFPNEVAMYFSGVAGQFVAANVRYVPISVISVSALKNGAKIRRESQRLFFFAALCFLMRGSLPCFISHSLKIGFVQFLCAILLRLTYRVCILLKKIVRYRLKQKILPLHGLSIRKE